MAFVLFLIWDQMFISSIYSRRSLGWLTVRSRRLYLLGIATFNIMQGSSPPYLRDLLNRSAPSVRPSRHTSPRMYLLSKISVPQPFKIHFTCPQFFLALDLWYCSLLADHWDPQGSSIQALVWPRVWTELTHFTPCIVVWFCSPRAQLSRHFSIFIFILSCFLPDLYSLLRIVFFSCFLLVYWLLFQIYLGFVFKFFLNLFIVLLKLYRIFVLLFFQLYIVYSWP